MIWHDEQGVPRDPERAMSLMDELDDLQAEPPLIRGYDGEPAMWLCDVAVVAAGLLTLAVVVLAAVWTFGGVR